jgi:glutamate-1-semialdehyde 2,1-aminomutase
VLDRAKLTQELSSEKALHLSRTPSSRALYEASDHLLGRVPMTWMNKWSGGYPLYLQKAHGNRITDVDGNEYVDFALGDTAAMAGHSPVPTTNAVQKRIAEQGGITTMMPTADAEWVANELTRRFGLPLWSFTLTATDANRWALRIARQVSGKSKVLAFSYSYHGAVDETLVRTGPNGTAILREGNVGPAVDIAQTTRVAEFNDLESVEAALAHGDVAVVITEPALTNIGIVLPQPGFLTGLRELCDKYSALLLIDETHTFSAGWGGCTTEWDLKPDIFVIGKSIGGGIPCGAYGISQQLADKILNSPDADLEDVGGVGGTLAGNAMSTAAMRATLGEVLTPQAFDHMIELASQFRAGVENALAETQMPWTVAQIGARAEYRFCSPAPLNGTESAQAYDGELEEFLHLFMSNRGLLMTPFHNMALMCPETSSADIELHTALFAQALSRISQ